MLNLDDYSDFDWPDPSSTQNHGLHHLTFSTRHKNCTDHLTMSEQKFEKPFK